MNGTPRTLATIFLCLGVFFLPWWVVSLVALGALFLFDFWPVIFVAFFLDLVWGEPSPIYMRFLFLCSFFALYIASLFVKRNFRGK